MAKDDKKKKKKKKNGHKGEEAQAATGTGGGQTAARLKAISENPIVADVVAAALIGVASALKDSSKARQIAEHAADRMGDLGGGAAKEGSALWQLALDVGRRTLDTLAADAAGKGGKAKTPPKAE